MRSATALVALALVVCTGCATGVTGTPLTVSDSGAGIEGSVISDTGGEVEYWAEYGPTTAYGFESTHDAVGAEANTLTPVSAFLGGLARDTVYHYRLCARDSNQKGGPACGEDRRLRTQSVACGETVTSDVRLTGNLDCQQNGGLTVGADGVEINLGGYQMNGGIFVGSGGPSAVDNSAGYDDLTVRNGSVIGFGEAALLVGASRNRVLDLGVGVAGNGIDIQGGSFNEVRNSNVFGRSSGILATGSDSLLIAGTRAGGAFGSGIDVTGDLARIVRNHVIRDSGPFANPSGIELVGSGARIADNRVDGAWNGGMTVTGANNVVVDNVVTRAAFPVMGDPPWAGDGIFIGAFSSGTVLRRNRTDDNEGDGIEVRANGTRLEGNAAFGNGDWGIDAVTGVVDLGGNIAGGNGNPGQCNNVFCP